jgi:hypothetical protein
VQRARTIGRLRRRLADFGTDWWRRRGRNRRGWQGCNGCDWHGRSRDDHGWRRWRYRQDQLSCWFPELRADRRSRSARLLWSEVMRRVLRKLTFGLILLFMPGCGGCGASGERGKNKNKDIPRDGSDVEWVAPLVNAKGDKEPPKGKEPPEPGKIGAAPKKDSGDKKP